MECSPAFIERLETASNSKITGVLHDELIARGQPFPLGLQNMSHHVRAMVKNENDIEVLGHLKHAVSALYDRVPSEVLRQIFLFLVPGHRTVQTVIPPLLSSPSWVLGQVNSTWRHLSRSMNELWGTATLKLTDNCISPDTLQRAFSTLPDTCKIDVHVVNVLGVAKAALVPYLPRVHALQWELDGSQLVNLWSMLSPNALSKVVTLDLTCFLPSRSAVDNGESMTGRFFGEAARLRSLKLDVPKGIFPKILSVDFPWEHLTSLCITCRSEHDTDILTKALCGCTALNRLDLRFYVRSSYKACNPLTLDKIKFLTLLGFVPHFLLLSSCVWNGLNELCLERISLPISSFCCILSQCSSIEHLSCCISSGELPTSERPLILSHLRTLSITLRQVHIFSLLRTPALRKIVITALDHLELLSISRFITDSECVVDSFTMSNTEGRSNPVHLRELLSSLVCVISFSMRGATVHDDSLDGVASGTLLPNVRSLLVSTRTFYAYMSMVERRLQWEQGLGKVRISVIEGSAPEGVSERAMRRLKEVGQQYGVCCQFYEDAVDVFQLSGWL